MQAGRQLAVKLQVGESCEGDRYAVSALSDLGHAPCSRHVARIGRHEGGGHVLVTSLRGGSLRWQFTGGGGGPLLSPSAEGRTESKGPRKGAGSGLPREPAPAESVMPY